MILLQKRGMTLIELMVGLLLFMLITTAVFTIIAPVMNVYAKANELAECNALLDNIANQMIKDLARAKVELNPDELGEENPDKLSITIDSPDDAVYTVNCTDVGCPDIGALHKNGSATLLGIYFKNKSVSFFCDPIPDDNGVAYKLTVIILSDKGGEMARREYAVQPMRLIDYTE